MAVLVRAGFQTREFEERLITLGVPYRVIGGPRFYERMEIRDAVAYFRMVAQPSDDLAFERIVNVPRRGLGPATLQTVHRLARAKGIPLDQAVRRLLETDEIKPRARGTLGRLMADFERWRALLDHMPPAELAGLIMDESGYTEMWKTHKSIEAPGRLENLREVVAAMAEFETLGGFLEHISLVMEIDEHATDDKVNLMTLHGAKGLEFDTVFLPGWEEGLFPHQRALDEDGDKGLEEERRLAYVGLTRARHRALITFAASRRIYNQWQSALPSRFVDELPAEYVDHATEPGLYGGPAAGEERLRHRRRRAVPHAVPLADAAWQSAPSGGGSGLAAGQRVFHQKFGYGRVVAIDGDKAEIAFEKAGHKLVMTSFVAAV
jgi:DNA helicase-2/ATP-dependent DNA helicase PcrA